MQISGCGQAVRFPVKDNFLILVVKSAEKSAITRDSPTENTITSNPVSDNPAKCW
jgi:hypothetical protein